MPLARQQSLALGTVVLALCCAGGLGSGCKKESQHTTLEQPSTTNTPSFITPSPTTPAIAPGSIGAPAALSAAVFHTVPLDGFYQRQFVDYRPSASWAQVPRGETNFDGVPFLMIGKIDLTGLGRARDGEFHPSQVGAIPVGQKAGRLHLIHGASYDAPDDTPIASLRLRYENGETRSLFVRYGVHVRNWYIEARETNPELSDARSLVIWNGHSGPDGTGTPTRLFKTTFDNPLPSQVIQSIDLLSLFARANSVMLAITLEGMSGGPVPPESGWDEDDGNYRREVVLRAVDANTGKAVSTIRLNLSVIDRDRTYRFGEYPGENGQVRFSYPPGRFSSLLLSLSVPSYKPETVKVDSENGLFEPEQTVRLTPQ